jgi:hypothetical protein
LILMTLNQCPETIPQNGTPQNCTASSDSIEGTETIIQSCAIKECSELRFIDYFVCQKHVLEIVNVELLSKSIAWG